MKKIGRLILAGVLSISLAVPVSAQSSQTTQNVPSSKKVIASYLPMYQSWTAEEIQGDKVTDLIIAFGMLNENHQLYFPYNNTPMNEITRLKELYPNLKVSLSLGGGAAGGFSEMAASDQLRQQFVKDTIAAVRQYGFDGVDVDWEYPVGAGWLPESEKKWQDKENFTKLISEFRVELDQLEKENNQEYLLCYAANPSEWAITNLEYQKIFEMVDRIYVMGYDFSGGWSDRTNHSSNLYNYPESQWGISTDLAIKTILNYGAPKEKVVLGVPNYAHDFHGVANINNGLGQKFTKADTLNLGYLQLKNNYFNQSGFIRYWDDHAKMPYLYNGDIFISYEDAESIGIKADYILENGLGGMMSWEYTHDKDGDLLNTVHNKFK